MTSDPIFAVFLSLAALIFYRNTLVFRVVSRRLAEVYAANIQRIDENKTPDQTLYETGSYTLQMFDLTKWTYRQFFPVSAAEQMENAS